MPQKSNKIHLVYVPMTGVGLYGGYRGDEWYKYRIEIFKRYTLKSLLNQSESNFILWMSFRPEEEKNPLTAELAHYLETQKLEYILTFDGLMYWDDKFTQELIPKLYNYGRILRECWRWKSLKGLYSSLKEIYQNKNSTLRERVGRSTAIIKKHFNMDWVYVTRLDSDDMLHQDAIREIQVQIPFEGAFTFRNGYIHNTTTEEVAYYEPKENPPFHTIVFKADTFFDPEKYLDYFKDFKSHEDIPRVFQTIRLSDGRFCVTTHQNHISTIWNHPFKGELVSKGILSKFGIYAD